MRHTATGGDPANPSTPPSWTPAYASLSACSQRGYPQVLFETETMIPAPAGPRIGSEVLHASNTWTAALRYWVGRSDAAVITPQATWSGAELISHAAGAAAHLSALTDSSAPIPALLTATAGNLAYVIGGASASRPLAPLGTRHTPWELGPVVDALHAEVLLADMESEPLAQAIAADRALRVVVIDEPEQRTTPLEFAKHANSVAFVLHTSGTTGLPKPVAFREDRLVARTRVNVAVCSFGPGSVYASASPFHHIAGLGNYAVALAAGAAVAPIPRFSVKDWSGLAGIGVTHALTVPTVLEMLLDAGVLALPDLHTLTYGAAPIHPALLDRVLAELPRLNLVNLFGQTEGSPITCLGPEDHRRIRSEGRSELLTSVGVAAPGVDLQIAKPDATGVGEVIARAAHFCGADPDGWLRTGDLGCLRDGYLYLSGRLGDKIIRGGENVYPAEVENVLLSHPLVRDAAVIGISDPKFGQVVKAVIVSRDVGSPPDFDALRAYTRERLAGFKVPAVWEAVGELPRSPTGKVLRRSLI